MALIDFWTVVFIRFFERDILDLGTANHSASWSADSGDADDDALLLFVGMTSNGPMPARDSWGAMGGKNRDI